MPKQLRYFDYTLALAVTALAVFGIFMIYAATNTGAVPDEATAHRSQILFVATGVILMLTLAFIDYRFITKFYIPIYALCILLLLYVKFFGTGDPNVPDRWIFIPVPGLNSPVSIQPSEFAKIFMIIVLAKFIDNHKDNFNHILMLLVILAGIALPVGLIAWQPSLSACVVVLVVSLVVLFTGGLYYRTIFAALALIVPAGLAVLFDILRETPLFIRKFITEDYQWKRVQTFLNPVPGSDEYMQMEASLFSIGSGGLYGKGFMKNGHVPNGHNDFIFSVAAEQFGFAGCMVILGVMAFIIVKCILIALRAEDIQGRLIAAGTAGMLLFETFVNVGVVTELLPNTGMAFPFLSAGGSIMWVHMIAIGLVMNISIPRDKAMFNSERI